MVTTPWRRRREQALEAMEQFRQARRIIDEDVTVLGEQLAELHVETLTDTLDAAARRDYQQALDGYERATTMLREAGRAEDLDAVLAIEPVVTDARFHRACVLARVEGVPVPTRREPCFFNPQHLPSVVDVAWTPPGGVERPVAVCPTCSTRLAGGEAPDVRLVKVGDRWVPWWAGGGSADRLVRHRAHLVRGSSWHTDLAIAEVHAKAGAAAAQGFGFGP